MLHANVKIRNDREHECSTPETQKFQTNNIRPIVLTSFDVMTSARGVRSKRVNWAVSNDLFFSGKQDQITVDKILYSKHLIYFATVFSTFKHFKIQL